MNSLWQPPNYGPRELENNIYNSIFQAHDTGCGCKDVILHLLQIISRDNPKKLTIKELKEIKWRLTGEEEDQTAATTRKDAFNPENLELLFAQNEKEKDTAATG